MIKPFALMALLLVGMIVVAIELVERWGRR